MVEPSIRFEDVRIPLPEAVHGLDAVTGVLGVPEWWPTGSRIGIVLAQATQIPSDDHVQLVGTVQVAGGDRRYADRARFAKPGDRQSGLRAELALSIS